MMGTFAGAVDQLEVDGAARTQEHGGLLCVQARAIGRQEQVGSEFILQRCADFVQAGRADFFAHLEQDLGVEAEPAAAHRQHAGQSREVDAVLALVVGCAPAIPAFTVDLQRPGG